ncbi:MAG TPA: GAF domain-containing sensor histidine kinase [Mucilaginibacter sp.]|jgi:signal transduction histidine kinase|nr:GAF domain-containing sensor histidine kinase [Mucilaginibacter sp.]
MVNNYEAEQRKTRIVSLISLELSRPASLKEKLNNILYFLDTIFGLKHTMLLLPEGEYHLAVFASRGFADNGLGVTVKYGVGVIGVVADRKKKLRVSNISRKKQYVRIASGPESSPEALPGLTNAESQVAIPLLADDKLIAVLSAESEDLNFFSPEDEEFLMTLSQIIGLSIENTQIMESLEQLVSERTLSLEVQTRKLQQANASKDKLFAIIAHDLRSPAASLESTAKLMRYHIEANDNSRISATGERVARSASKLSRMLDNLLTWSLTQSGDLKINKEPVEITALLSDVIHTYEDDLDSKKVTCAFDCQSPITILSDIHACFSIFHNLVSNAVKFSHFNGRIDITIDQSPTQVDVIIRDHGIGMAKEKVQEILENAVNTSTKGTANEKGTGIGLGTSLDLIKRIGGQVIIESEFGSGTAFKVMLPASL